LGTTISSAGKNPITRLVACLDTPEKKKSVDWTGDDFIMLARGKKRGHLRVHV